VVCGQAFLGRADRAELLLRIWIWSYACVAAGIVAYLMLRFGTGLIASTDRGPFQLAIRAIFPTWPNYFGTALAVGICYPFARLLTGRSGPVVWVALPILLVTLLVTFSRTAIAVTGIALFVMAVAGGRARKMLPVALATVIILAGLAALLPAVGFQFAETLRPGSSQQLGVFERYAYAAEAVRLWRQHPLFGIGFGRFDEFAELPRIIQRAGFEGVTLGSVHNEYVTTLLKGGVLGALGFGLILVVSIGAFRRALRSVDLGVRVLGLSGIGIATVLGLAGFTAETFRTLSVAGPFWVLAGSVSVICARDAVSEAPPADSGVSPS
jgi:O-antigen ligase